MGPTQLAALLVVGAAVALVLRGAEVRLTLLGAALALGLLAGDAPAIVRAFLATLVAERFALPICSAMGFAYALKHSGCDTAMVRVLVLPVRRARRLVVPGVVLAGFTVNIPVISQTSAAICLGAVAVPLMRAAGYGPAAVGATLVLGASVGGELLNPGAPELNSVRDVTSVDTPKLVPRFAPLVGLMLVAATLAHWLRTPPGELPPPESGESGSGFVPLAARDWPKAVVPLVPLLFLMLSGPPFPVFAVPAEWLADPGTAVPGGRVVGLAMLLGLGAIAVVAPEKSGGLARSFFEGAGYGLTHVVSLIVTATCFGEGIRRAGLAAEFARLLTAAPESLVPLAALASAAFAWLCGSGMASTQSLFPVLAEPARAAGHDLVGLGGLVAVSSAAGRTASPVAAVVLMGAQLSGATPRAILARLTPALAAGLAVVVAAKWAGAV